MSDAVSAPPWMAIDSTTAVSLRNTRSPILCQPAWHPSDTMAQAVHCRGD
jgi:hypothetical protein